MRTHISGRHSGWYAYRCQFCLCSSKVCISKRNLISKPRRSIQNFPPLFERPFLHSAMFTNQFILEGYFPLDFVSTPGFDEQTFWRRCFFMVPTFTVFRTRMYVAWLLAECVAITGDWARWRWAVDTLNSLSAIFRGGKAKNILAFFSIF